MHVHLVVLHQNHDPVATITYFRRRETAVRYAVKLAEEHGLVPLEGEAVTWHDGEKDSCVLYVTSKPLN